MVCITNKMNKKEPYIIAVDMDGTLLNSKKKICLKTLFYLRKLTKQGHKIILASGRPARALKCYYDKLGLNTPMVCYNGSYVFSPSDKNFKPIDYRFSAKMVLDITNKLKKYILNIMCETDTDVWIDKEDNYLHRYFWVDNMNIHKGNINKTLNEPVKTCLIHTQELNNIQKREIEKVVRKYKGICPRFWIGNPYFELGYENASKGSGLEYIAKYYKIKRNHVIAFGDAPNDEEMLAYAGTGIAMCNARTTLKNAKMITIKDNNHNGIYYTLKKILNV